MKCHWCGETLEKVIYYSEGKEVVRNHYECPAAHADVHMKDGNVSSYTFFFFIDEEGSRRYKVNGLDDGTVVLSGRVLERAGGYKELVRIPNGPKLEIEDDVPQVKRIYQRLRKLAIFA
jgi:hypothetical protein